MRVTQRVQRNNSMLSKPDGDEDLAQFLHSVRFGDEWKWLREANKDQIQQYKRSDKLSMHSGTSTDTAPISLRRRIKQPKEYARSFSLTSIARSLIRTLNSSLYAMAENGYRLLPYAGSFAVGVCLLMAFKEDTDKSTPLVHHWEEVARHETHKPRAIELELPDEHDDSVHTDIVKAVAWQEPCAPRFQYEPNEEQQTPIQPSSPAFKVGGVSAPSGDLLVKRALPGRMLECQDFEKEGRCVKRTDNPMTTRDRS